MANLGTLSVGLRGDYGGLSRDLNKGEGIISGFTGRVGGLLRTGLKLGGIGTVIAGALASAGIGAAINAELDKIDVSVKLADRLGIGTEALTGLEHAAGLAGASSATLEKGLEGMLKRLGQAATKGGAPAEALASIGMTAEELSSLSPEDAFKQLADAIGKTEDPARRAFLATELFGRSGQDLLPLFMSGAAGIEAAASEAEALGLAFSRADGAKVEAANDAMSRMKATAVGVARSITIAVAPALTSMAQYGTAAGIKVVSAVKSILPPIVSVFGQVMSFVAPLAGSIASTVGSALSTVAGQVVGVWQAVGPTVLSVLMRLRGIATQVGTRISAAWATIGPFVARVATVVGAAIAGIGGAAVIAGVATLIAGAIGTAVAVAAGFAGTLVAVAAAAAPVVAGLAVVATGIGAVIAAAGGVGPILSAVQGAWGRVYQFVSGVVGGIATAVRTRWNQILGAVTSVGTAVYGVVVAGFTAVWSVIKTVGGAVASVWSSAMRMIGFESQSTAGATTSAFGRIIDAVTWVADKVTLGANVFGFALGNVRTIADYAVASVVYQMTRLGNVVGHGFMVGVEYAKWFGSNFTTLVSDSMRLGWTITKNAVGNIAEVISNLPGLIAGTTDIGDIWKPLTTGFEARVSALPEIAARVPGELESAFKADRDALGSKLGNGFAKYLADQEANAQAAGQRLTGIFEGITGLGGGVLDSSVVETTTELVDTPTTVLNAPEIEQPIIPDPELPELPGLSTEVDVKMPELIGIQSAQEQLLRYAAPELAISELGGSPTSLADAPDVATPTPVAATGIADRVQTPKGVKDVQDEIGRQQLAEQRKQTAILTTIATRESEVSVATF